MPVTIMRGRELRDPDPYLVRDQLWALQNMYNVYGAAYWCRNMLWILRKNPEPDTKQMVLKSAQWNRRLVPFAYNRIQHDLERTMGDRNICLKYRQGGYCVKKDTLITLANGKTITFGQIAKGMLALNEAGLPVSIKNIFRIPDFAQPYRGRAVEITSTADSRPFTVAPNHPWMTQRGMVESKNLCCNDYLAQPRRKLSKSELLCGKSLGIVAGLKIGGATVNCRSVHVSKATPKKTGYVEVHVLHHVQEVLQDKKYVESLTAKFVTKELGCKISDKIWRYGKEFLEGLLTGWLVARGDWYRRSIEAQTTSALEASVLRQVCLALGVGLPRLEKGVLIFNRSCYELLHEMLYGTKLVSLELRTDQYVDGDFVFVRVKVVKPARCDEFFDIEVDSESHLYWLPIGLTHNTTFFINRRLYLPSIIEPGSNGLLISQKSMYATLHFGILKRSHRYVGCVDLQNAEKNLLHQQLTENLLHLAYSNRKELIFDQLDSRIIVESAEVEEAAQGVTLNHVHATEVARWPGNPEATLANMKEAIAVGGTLDLESTANGQGGYFFEEYSRAKRGGQDAEFVAHFHQWFWQDEYRLSPPMDEEDLSDDEIDKMLMFQLDMEQMTWRRKKQVSLRHECAEKYPETDVGAFLSMSRMFYDADIASARMVELSVFEPLARERNGEIIFFQRPIRGRRYVAGADPAEGKQINNEESDWSCGKIIDEETGEDCCAYRAKLPPEDFAADMVELCEYFNNALLVIERNNHGGTVILAARSLGYGNIYKHREWTKRERRSYGTGKNANSNTDKKQWMDFEGWPESTKTRKILLNKSAEFLRHWPELVWDYDMLTEIMVFVYDEKGIPKAMEGYHDDRVFAWALAHIGRLVTLGYLDPLTFKARRYGETEDETEPTIN